MTDEQIKEEIRLIDERGGYQLYLLPDDTPLCPYDSDTYRSAISQTLLDSNDKVKIMTQEYEDKRGKRILNGFPYSLEESNILQKTVDFVFERLDNSAVRMNRGNRTLEEVVEFLKKKRNELGAMSFLVDSETKTLNKLPIGRGHDTDYAQVLKGAFGPYHLDYPLIFSIPEELLNKRDSELQKYGEDSVILQELDFAVNFKEYLKKGIDSVEPWIMEKVAQKISSKPISFNPTPQRIKECILRDLDYLPQEIRRHETTLNILNYLKSRVKV